MSGSGRLAALEAMVVADPGDLLARLLLGRELLASGDAAGAAQHLALYCEREEGDKGAACGAWAEALAALGQRRDAQAALDLGIANARVHRHLGLVTALEQQRADLDAS